MPNPNRDLILCAACKVKPAIQFISVDIERVNGTKVRYQHVGMWLCEQCAKSASASTSTSQRLAEALSGGAK